MNGGLIIWTEDDANIEIREETVEDDMLSFQLLTPEIDSAHSKMKHGEHKVQNDCLSEAIGQIRKGMDCVSGTSGLILSRNAINLLSSGLVMYTMLTLLFLIEIKTIVKLEYRKNSLNRSSNLVLIWGLFVFRD